MNFWPKKFNFSFIISSSQKSRILLNKSDPSANLKTGYIKTVNTTIFMENLPHNFSDIWRREFQWVLKPKNRRKILPIDKFGSCIIYRWMNRSNQVSSVRLFLNKQKKLKLNIVILNKSKFIQFIFPENIYKHYFLGTYTDKRYIFSYLQ